MKREIHNFTQGSPEWHAYRATPNQFNASDAPAMLGESPYKTRDQLLKELATGITQEVSAGTQHVFNEGHRFEAEDRPRAEEFIGQELYPATVSIDLGGFKLSSSLDGWTMCEEIIYEHKTKNKIIIEFAARNEIAIYHRIQMEQQFLCSGATKCLFTGSLGNEDKEPVRIWYESDPALRERLIAGWKQFAIDLANYVLPEAEAPKAIAEPVATLPAITYQTKTGNKGLELASNLEIYKEAAQKLVEQSKKKLETDQDFANAESRIKACKDAEERIAVIQSNVIGEVADIDKFVKDLGAISEMLRQCRLNEDKQVKKRKEDIKLEEITRASNEWNAVIVGYNEQLWKLAKVQMPAVYVDLQGAIKGLKTVSSLRSKLNDELARGKIEASALFEKICLGISLIQQLAGDKLFLFSDLQNIVGSDSEYIAAIVGKRIADYEAAEQVRIQAEAKRIADEQIEKDRQAELAKAQAAAVEAVKPLEAEVKPLREEQAELFEIPVFEEVPEDYEQYATNTKHFDQSFEQVFGGDSVEPMVDLSDFQKGRAEGRAEGFKQGLELALKIFAKSGSAGFAKAVQDFIEVGMPETVSKAA